MVETLIYDTYLRMIKNSVGTKLFRNLYLEINKERIDATRNGKFSCAYFVSAILLMSGLIKEMHATVDKTVKDMEKFGWKRRRIAKVKPGDIIAWERMMAEDKKLHSHIGFYIGNKKAISNSWQKRIPAVHSWNYNGKRKIIAIYHWPKFK